MGRRNRNIRAGLNVLIILNQLILKKSKKQSSRLILLLFKLENCLCILLFSKLLMILWYYLLMILNSKGGLKLKLIRRRDYNTKKRLGFEGLYLEESGFKENTPIECSVDKNNGSIMITVVGDSRKCSYKVTRNITRSGKIVPAICIKNKTIESFVESFDNLEIIIFKGVIILASKDKNRNIIISKALIAHNKSLRENIKTVVSSLINLGLITDSIMLDELNEVDISESYSFLENIKRIPKKILCNLKKTFKFNLVDKSKYVSGLTNTSSNSFILSCIIDNSKEDLDADEETEDGLIESLVLTNYFAINHCFLSLLSYKSQVEFLYRRHSKDCLIYVYKNIVNDTCFKEKIKLSTSFKKRIEYLNIQISFRLFQLGFLFLKIRKLINTLSPPLTSKTCLKCLM